MMVGAEQPARLDHRIGDRPAGLFQHQPFDRAKLRAVAPVDGDVLHAIAGNQGVHGVLPVSRSAAHHSTNEAALPPDSFEFYRLPPAKDSTFADKHGT